VQAHHREARTGLRQPACHGATEPMLDESQLTEAKRKLLERMRGGNLTPAALASSDVNSERRDLPIPLSLAQEQVWRLEQTAGKLAPLHNESITIHRHGACDPRVLERSLTEIVRRHEIWRTTFALQHGQPVQIVHPAPADFRIPVDDLRHLPQSQVETAAIALATADARAPFDLERGPLFRLRLITLRDHEHSIYLTAHQSIVDGITVFDIFPYELTTLYEVFSCSQSSPLPELQKQFADFALWQRRNYRAGAMDDQLKYWENQLGGELPVLSWPKGIRPSRQTYRGGMHSFAMPAELAQRLKNLGRRESATLFMILLAGLMLLLRRYTGQDDIIVGTLAPSGRKHSEFQRLLGYFLNPVALRANLAGNPPFPSLLRQIRDITLAAVSNDDVPLEIIAQRLQYQPDPRRHPFFTVALSVAPDVAALPSGWKMTYMDVESGGARWDLYIEMSDRAEALLGRAQYNPDLFTSREIAETVHDLQELLEKIAASSSC